jgi:hypothetical protein
MLAWVKYGWLQKIDGLEVGGSTFFSFFDLDLLFDRGPYGYESLNHIWDIANVILLRDKNSWAIQNSSYPCVCTRII